jgi:hypothetical protein
MVVMKKAFSTFQPEVVENILVFDWKMWFAPWAMVIKHHAKW